MPKSSISRLLRSRFDRTLTSDNAQKGFTLVETIIATLILSLSIGALLSLAAGGFFSVRYARNQIVADNLLQESLEYIRKSRDDAFIQGVSWTTWLASLNVNSSGALVDPGTPSGCFVADGCSVDPYTSQFNVKACGATCPSTIFYPLSSGGFYGYSGGDYPFSTSGITPITTSYVRKITTQKTNSDQQLVVTAQIQWLNGNATKTVSQSMILSNWSQP